jgi:toxin HigB-1
MIVSYRDAKLSVLPKASGSRGSPVSRDRLKNGSTGWKPPSLQDLAALPGNVLEPLRGDRKGQYSIRINDQWRICFEWPKGANGPVNVEITDYH